MRWLGFGGRTSQALVTGTAAFAAWAFLVNRWIINWVDGDAKRFVTPALALVLGAFAFVPLLRRWPGPWAKVGALIIALFTLGELRRAWLRHQYALEQAGGASIELFHPVTTTDLVVRHFELPLRGLGVPRLRVVALSDLHVTEELPEAYYERVLDELREREPDLVLLTGDYLSRIGRLPQFEAFLRKLPRGRYGAFAVLGNHDHWLHDARVAEVFARVGIPLLSGSCVPVPASGTPAVRLCGTEEPWGPSLARDTVARALPAGAPLLVMSHTPDNIYELRDLGASAVFAGHTHGGQFRLPLVGSVVIPSRYGRRFDWGHFTVDGTHLFVSAGVGADQPPLRLYCNPELVEVDFTDAAR
jgi:predicted MPP superfamily phosphohydrolase